MKKYFFRLLLCGACFLMSSHAIANPFIAMKIKPQPDPQPLALDFELKHMNGTTARLKDFGGNVILLNFWATWCLPCIREMPDMEVLWQRYKASGLVVLGVSSDDAKKRKRVATFIKKVNLSFPILLDPESTVSDSYNVSAIPVSFLIDRNGVILAEIIGVREWASPASFALIEHLLEQVPQH